MTVTPIRSPDLPKTLGPLIPSLRAAAVSLQPSESVLPLLTPILRQRVQFLSLSSTNDPWIRLLCYDTSKVSKLTEIAQGERLEPHPASGEIEIDWDYDTETRFRRLDEETLEAFVASRELELAFRLLYCTLDGEESGWKVGEVTVPDRSSPFSSFGGASTIDEAERQFKESKLSKSASASTSNGLLNPQNGITGHGVEDDDDDDDDYWARYDATPGTKTPATKRSPAPQISHTWNTTTKANEDDYFAQYDHVQPAMDNHDPDEEAHVDVSPPLGLAPRAMDATQNGHSDGEVAENGIQDSWMLAEPPKSSSPHSKSDDEPGLVHPCPRPGSSAGSNASVEKLEAAAARQEQNDFGVKQHVSRSIKSLFLLSRASGIDREEFERMVKTELDMLGLMED
ncbi:hypothetical protein F5B22DRAFT_479016 [Xylaria bambusicola]|uniref:uncharacterized protein n=1 Tax=Xylaria bambusicola TaxID=326684 RepID=UPI00200751C4|nr:uncharacterized protein F5B22DRAFT_479016 [Xylaria bambusicola]KAI0506110.1 hypothetical protein F5B22DRAFT_479016 [Xylaria bambusicola]